MSLLYGLNGEERVTLAALWRYVHENEEGESEIVPFWSHYLQKFAFPERKWVEILGIRPEKPQSNSSERRFDRGIHYFAQGEREIILRCWIYGEGTPTTSKDALREVEEKARWACKRYLDSHPWQESIYAFTTILTMGKAWIYTRDEGVLTPMHDLDDYIEANSNDGYKLGMCFERMKAFPPTPPAESLPHSPNLVAA